VAHPQIAVFARLAEEDAAPTRLIAGQKTKLARTMHDIRYDPVHDEFWVGNPFAGALMAYRGGADGEEAPIRIIQGPDTMLQGPDRLEVDYLNNELIVPEHGNTILVFPSREGGNVAPIRVIQGPKTQLQSVRSAGVDMVRNLIVAGTQHRTPEGEQLGILLVYDRTADGDEAPLRVIEGEKTEIVRITQLRVYSPRGWILAAQSGTHEALHPKDAFVGVWHIDDEGNVPPRYRIRGPKTTLIKPRGIVLDVKNKEVIISDMSQNAIFTYYFPELF
jgi:hypothetical protein